MSNSKKIVIGFVKNGGKVAVWQSEALEEFMTAHAKDINVVYSKEFGYASCDQKTGLADWDHRYMVDWDDRLNPEAHAKEFGKNAKELKLSPLAQAYVSTLGLTPFEAVRKERAELKKQAKKNS